MAALDRAHELPDGLIVSEYGGFLAGTADPAATSVDAPIGTVYTRSDGAIWKKTGAAASAWSLQFDAAGDLPVGRLNSGTGAGATTFWRGDGTWAQPKVVQVVRAYTGAVMTTTTQIPLDDTVPRITEGAEVLTVTITPTRTTNILLVQAALQGSINTSNRAFTVAIFRDAVANALAAESAPVASTNLPIVCPCIAEQVAGSTAATTFRLRAGPGSANTLTINGSNGARRFGGVNLTSLVVWELAP